MKLYVPLFGSTEYSLQSKAGLARELWSTFCELHGQEALSLAYSLNKLDFEPANPAIVQQRLAHLQEALTAKKILTACVRLSPEGRPRRKDVLTFEEHLLTFVDKDGNLK